MLNLVTYSVVGFEKLLYELDLLESGLLDPLVYSLYINCYAMSLICALDVFCYESFLGASKGIRVWKKLGLLLC